MHKDAVRTVKPVENESDAVEQPNNPLRGKQVLFESLASRKSFVSPRRRPSDEQVRPHVQNAIGKRHCSCIERKRKLSEPSARLKKLREVPPRKEKILIWLDFDGAHRLLCSNLRPSRRA